MEIIADHGRMLSFEIVEVNPVIDEHHQTADLAVDLILLAVFEAFIEAEHRREERREATAS